MPSAGPQNRAASAVAVSLQSMMKPASRLRCMRSSIVGVRGCRNSLWGGEKRAARTRPLLKGREPFAGNLAGHQTRKRNHGDETGSRDDEAGAGEAGTSDQAGARGEGDSGHDPPALVAAEPCPRERRDDAT